MAKLPKAVTEAMSKQKSFPVATSSSNSVPNVAYITYLKAVDDETVLIVDNYLNKTRENVVNVGNVSFAVLDEKKGSYQVKGVAQRLTQGELFDEVQQWVPDKYPKVAAVVMKVEEVYNGAEKIA